tara:strand:- start:422 stop:538 length:117 start_codon:yes stop_codon:yes gene_type:complete
MRHKNQINLILDFIRKIPKIRANNLNYLHLEIVKKNKK